MACRNTRVLIAAVAIAGLAHAKTAQAQAPAGYSYQRDPAVTAASATTPSYARLTGQNNPAINYFGGRLAQRNAAPARQFTPPPAARPLAGGASAKPFSGFRQSSNITPYLNLDARESENSPPNYYTFVRPQIEQQQWNQAQQIENRRLQQQLRVASAGASIVPSPNGGIPTTGHSTQYMNSSGYYPTR